MNRYCLSIYPPDKRPELEQAIKAAGYSLTVHPEYPDDICFQAPAPNRQSLPIRSKLEAIAPGIKIHGPM